MAIPAERRKAHGLILAGTQSGDGKTAITCMLLSALRKRGVPFQPFKAGPDFIDVSYHSRFAGVPSRNLDTWLFGEQGLLDEAQRYGAGKISIVEGVMGLFDGAFATSEVGSTMEIARRLDWPVVLVLPCSTAGRSIAAVLRGFCAEAGPDRIAGVILNQVGGSGHAQYLRDALASLKIPVLGAVTKHELLRWPERHLGLQAAQERILPAYEELASLAEQFCDVESLLRLVEAAPPLKTTIKSQGSSKRLAIAHDEAFHFYYASNLDYLKERGISCVEFSPLRDRSLPADIDGVILGGGFPEVYAEPLSANQALRRELHSALRAGLPCYAECGGLMYLAEELQTLNGTSIPMVGFVPGRVAMTNTLQHFGYCEAHFPEQARGYRGHEFHHSKWEQETALANLWQVTKRYGGQSRTEGYRSNHVHASYVHLLWSQAPELIDSIFLKQP